MEKTVENFNENLSTNIIIAHRYHTITQLFIKILELEGMKRIKIVNSVNELKMYSKNNNSELIIVDDYYSKSSSLLQLKNSCENIKIVLITKYLEETQKGHPCIDEVINMPFDIWDVLLRIRKLLVKGE